MWDKLNSFKYVLIPTGRVLAFTTSDTFTTRAYLHSSHRLLVESLTSGKFRPKASYDAK
jgi:hypothetical protein